MPPTPKPRVGARRSSEPSTAPQTWFGCVSPLEAFHASTVHPQRSSPPPTHLSGSVPASRVKPSKPLFAGFQHNKRLTHSSSSTWIFPRPPFEPRVPQGWQCRLMMHAPGPRHQLLSLESAAKPATSSSPGGRHPRHDHASEPILSFEPRSPNASSSLHVNQRFPRLCPISLALMHKTALGRVRQRATIRRRRRSFEIQIGEPKPAILDLAALPPTHAINVLAV